MGTGQDSANGRGRAARKRRRPETPAAPGAPLALAASTAGASGPPLRVLVLSAHTQWRRSLCADLARSGVACTAVRTAASARGALAAERDRAVEGELSGYDAAVIDLDLPGNAGIEVSEAVQALGAAVVFAGASLRLDDAVNAMRAGACDLVGVETPRAEVARRVTDAAERARRTRRQEIRIDKLKRMCRRLNSARQRVTRQVDALCTDLVQAYQELADTMSQVTIATEFKGLIRQELDIESLLRTTLEFVLARSGPTNAAVFLPTTSGDYSLGAYVNYDCPRETVDILLDQLANTVAPRFEEAPGLVHMTDRGAVEAHVGDDAHWLGDSHVVAMPCRHEGETLAVFMLFRDGRTLYNGVLLDQLRTIGALFAAQLARVIHIHHRHLPKEKWGMLGDPEQGDDYGDLAA